MRNLESIVPPLELCKQIPAGEFEDSVLVWRDYSCLGYYVSERFAGETSDCRGEQKFDCVGNSGLIVMKATLPAPTLAEILAKLPEGVQMRMRTARNRERHFQIYHYSYETWTNLPAAAALRLWLRVRREVTKTPRPAAPGGASEGVSDARTP